MIIAIENLGQDKHLGFITKHMEDIQFNSMVVCPIYKHDDFFGVLSLKLPESKASILVASLRLPCPMADIRSNQAFTFRRPSSVCSPPVKFLNQRKSL
jgi:hypothetical protein